MRITVKFIGALRKASGGNQNVVDCQECSVKSLIETLSASSPDFRRSLVGSEGENEYPNALILVNGREISVLKGLATMLKDDDEVVFIPVVHGG